jgi:hypothetical protein
MVVMDSIGGPYSTVGLSIILSLIHLWETAPHAAKAEEELHLLPAIIVLSRGFFCVLLPALNLQVITAGQKP